MVASVYSSSAATGSEPPSAADAVRRQTVPPPPTNISHGAANTSGSRAVTASPSRNPARICERSSGQTAAARRPGSPGGRPPAVVRGSARRSDAPQGFSVAARESAPSATPTASSATSTATRWAKYHVLPTAAAHHHTVPVANTHGREDADAGPHREPPQHPVHERHAEGREQDADPLLVREQAEQRDERDQDDGGQRWKRQQRLAVWVCRSRP